MAEENKKEEAQENQSTEPSQTSQETQNQNEEQSKQSSENQSNEVADEQKSNEESKSSEDQPAEATDNQESNAESQSSSHQQKDPDEFLKEFDWHKYEEGIDEVDQDKLDNFEKMVADNFVDTLHNEVVKGKVVKITEDDAIIDINAKSEGVISLNEFRYNPDLQEGDEVDVFIDKREDAEGQLQLSHRKARVIKAWERVNQAQKDGSIVNGYVKCRTKGGMIVDVFGIEAFLPGSQIDVKPITDYDAYVGKTMEFKVVKINHEFKNVVVSHKALIEADIEEQKKEIIGQLEKGQVLEGVVKNITSYGVFVDLGGVDGLIHITDLSWSRINHPTEVLDVDQKLNVVILDFDEDKSRIQLGLKQLSKHPWETLDENLKEGDVVEGEVTVIADYGAFIEIKEGVEGLIHVSEMSWSTHLRSAQDFVSVGDKVKAKILTLDREERKMSLGIKQLTPDPWTDITSKYPVGSKHTGKVRNFTNFGVFVELEEGIDGLIYISDLSWTKKIKHPSEFCEVGDELDVVVLELDVEGRKLSLGHKQTEENPWDKYEKEFAVGTKHTAEISAIVDKGATIQFNDDVQAFVPARHLVKQDGQKLKKGEEAEFIIIEFNKEFKRVVASHSAIHKKEEEQIVKNAKKKQEDAQKTTIGDANAELQALKDKMNKDK